MATINMSDYGKGTIYSVSRGTGYSVTDIIAANPGIDIHDIASNATINLPSVVMESVNIDDYGTIYSISQKTGVSVDDIIASNPGININSIPAGASINLPSGSTIPIPKSALEVVNIDDYGSIYSISQKTGVSVDDIVAANPNIDIYDISSGTKINVPSKNIPTQKPPAVIKPTPKQEEYEQKVEDKRENDVGNEPCEKCKEFIIVIDPG
ncbi:MAG TPA: LysM domain-containing protein, partial [Candidatus Atribacteria bacterium]|nr:LysM domain-containing protein [Candidatus Atribacteria bacterium]